MDTFTTRLLVASLATYRIALTVVYDDGPARVLANIRDRFGVGLTSDDGSPLTLMGWLLGCFWCASLPVAFLVMSMLLIGTGTWFHEWLALCLAASGGAIVLNHIARTYPRV